MANELKSKAAAAPASLSDGNWKSSAAGLKTALSLATRCSVCVVPVADVLPSAMTKPPTPKANGMATSSDSPAVVAIVNRLPAAPALSSPSDITPAGSMRSMFAFTASETATSAGPSSRMPYSPSTPRTVVDTVAEATNWSILMKIHGSAELAADTSTPRRTWPASPACSGTRSSPSESPRAAGEPAGGAADDEPAPGSTVAMPVTSRVKSGSVRVRERSMSNQSTSRPPTDSSTAADVTLPLPTV